MNRRNFLHGLSAGALGLGASLMTSSRVDAGTVLPEQLSQNWKELKQDLFGQEQLHNGSSFMSLQAPVRAHKPALVPIRLTVQPDQDQAIEKLYLIVDENPAPVAAEIELSKLMIPVDLATRLRFNQHSNLRLVAQMQSGDLYQHAIHVKGIGGGGCSAPRMIDQNVAEKERGTFVFSQSTRDSGATSQIATENDFWHELSSSASMASVIKGNIVTESKNSNLAQMSSRFKQVQFMIKHPNNSGLQMDQVTLLNIPAFFIHNYKVHQGEELMMNITSGISISEDPVWQFKYAYSGAEFLTVVAEDTDGHIYKDTFFTAS